MSQKLPKQSFPRVEITDPGTSADDPHDISRIRFAALKQAEEQGVLRMTSEESRWLGQEARIAAETGTHEIPDVVAYRAAQAQMDEQAADQHNQRAA